MQKDSDKPLGAEKHLIAGTVAGKELLLINRLNFVSHGVLRGIQQVTVTGHQALT